MKLFIQRNASNIYNNINYCFQKKKLQIINMFKKKFIAKELDIISK